MIKKITNFFYKVFMFILKFIKNLQFIINLSIMITLIYFLLKNTIFFLIIIFSLFNIIFMETNRKLKIYYKIELFLSSNRNIFILYIVNSLMIRYYYLITIKYIDLFYYKKKHLTKKQLLIYLIIYIIVISLEINLLIVYLIIPVFKINWNLSGIEQQYIDYLDLNFFLKEFLPIYSNKVNIIIKESGIFYYKF